MKEKEFRIFNVSVNAKYHYPERKYQKNHIEIHTQEGRYCILDEKHKNETNEIRYTVHSLKADGTPAKRHLRFIDGDALDVIHILTNEPYFKVYYATVKANSAKDAELKMLQLIKEQEEFLIKRTIAVHDVLMKALSEKESEF